MPVGVLGLPGPTTHVSVGQAHTCARRGDGTVWCWGANSSGELGGGTTVGRLVATKSLMVNALSVAVGGVGYTCARTKTVKSPEVVYEF